jgi:hypothetical protein
MRIGPADLAPLRVDRNRAAIQPFHRPPDERERRLRPNGSKLY